MFRFRISLISLGLDSNQIGHVYVRPALKCPSNLQSLLKADIISVIFFLTYNLKDGLTDNMFKIKMEQLRNNRASKIASRKAFTLSYICNIILTVKVRKMLGVKTMFFAQHMDTKKTDNCYS